MVRLFKVFLQFGNTTYLIWIAAFCTKIYCGTSNTLSPRFLSLCCSPTLSSIRHCSSSTDLRGRLSPLRHISSKSCEMFSISTLKHTSSLPWFYVHQCYTGLRSGVPITSKVAIHAIWCNLMVCLLKPAPVFQINFDSRCCYSYFNLEKVFEVQS